MIKTNYHTHTKLCNHAEGMPIDYVARAVELGYREIGISDHGPLLKEWHYRMTIEEFYKIYLPEIEKAKKKYGDKIKIYRGLEIEYHPDFHECYERWNKDLDYLILGQHVIFTGPFIRDIYHDLNDEDIASYRDEVIAAMRTGYFKIFAHPDIYLFRRPDWNPFLEAAARAIVEAAVENDVILEINANGIRRKRILNQDGKPAYIYPRYEFWRVVSEYPEAKIIIGEDNHSPKYIDDVACHKARSFVSGLGLKPLIYLFRDET